jgi:hypothetical protein
MYMQSNPTSCAILALNPSYTPGATIMPSCSSILRSLLAAVGVDSCFPLTALVPLVECMVKGPCVASQELDTLIDSL